MVNKAGRPKKIYVSVDQPTWTCYDCGIKYGSFKCGTATWHHDTCGVCGRYKACTEPRDFGYFLSGWKDKLKGKDIVMGDKPDGE